MNIKSTKIFALFEKYRSKKLIFIEPRGNWGDDLIFRGGEKLAKLAGIYYESITCERFKNKSFTANEVLFIYGNGGFNNIWGGEHIEAFSKAVSNHPGIVILGPTTFYEDRTFLENRVKPILKEIKAENVHMFSRGTISYNVFVDIIPKHIDFQFDHDMALNLERKDLLPPSNKKSKGTLYAIRSDEESIEIPKYQPFLLWFDPIAGARSFKQWVDIHDGVKKIVTNRLHSAILGTILNKKVTLLPNSYGKNRGLWEFSLKEQGVIWKEDFTVSKLNRNLLKNKIYKKISNSYKVSQLTINPYLRKVSQPSK